MAAELAELAKMTPSGCITEPRLRALAQDNALIIGDRVQCPFNPAGPDRDHEFTATCSSCGGPKCPHCDCHEQ